LPCGGRAGTTANRARPGQSNRAESPTAGGTAPGWRYPTRTRRRDMHTLMSMRSGGLSSSGHPRAGPGGPTEPLRHTGEYACPAPGCILREAPPAARPDWVCGPRAGHRSCGSWGRTPLWLRGGRRGRAVSLAGCTPLFSHTYGHAPGRPRPSRHPCQIRRDPEGPSGERGPSWLSIGELLWHGLDRRLRTDTRVASDRLGDLSHDGPVKKIPKGLLGCSPGPDAVASKSSESLGPARTAQQLLRRDPS
jgi:hypothetical protein